MSLTGCAVTSSKVGHSSKSGSSPKASLFPRLSISLDPLGRPPTENANINNNHIDRSTLAGPILPLILTQLPKSIVLCNKQ